MKQYKWWMAGLVAVVIIGLSVPSVKSCANDSVDYPQGGMWMPEQIAQHADVLKDMGLSYDPSNLTDPLAYPLGAVIQLGNGCSASFVSPKGLIITNHHCVYGILNFLAVKYEKPYVEEGFYTKALSEELPAPPDMRIFVTRDIKNVSEEVLNGLTEIEDPLKRYKEVENRTKAIVKQCEQEKDVKCQVGSFFEGEKYYLVKKMEIKDIRMVHAPQKGVGVYGGDEDNFEWPRQTGDYGFLRAYVAPDGTPAAYSENNVPYQPKHFLKMPSEDLKKGDLAMVAGYPGSTERLVTAAAAKQLTESMPKKLVTIKGMLKILKEVGDQTPEVAAKVDGLKARLNNYRKLLEGESAGVEAAKWPEKKQAMEDALAVWIQEGGSPRIQKYGHVLPELKKIDDEAEAHGKRDKASTNILNWGFHWKPPATLFNVAHLIVRMAEERPKPDKERDPAFQERNWKDLEDGLRAMTAQWDLRSELPIISFFIMQATKLDKKDQPTKVLNAFLGEDLENITEAKVKASLDAFYKASKLSNEETRVQLFKTGTTKQLGSSTDPFVKAAFALNTTYSEIRDRAKIRSGQLVTIKPTYIAAIREFTGKVLAPDANSQLRISFGTVRGYVPKPGADMYEPFSTLSEMMAKHTGTYPFDVPKKVRDVIAAKKFGSYVDPIIGEVPVNQLTDLDITGGNSGSPMINRNGEIIGLLFDGNYEGLGSDMIFRPDVTRAISVDIRYVFWLMDAVYDSDHLLQEMGVTPSIGG